MNLYYSFIFCQKKNVLKQNGRTYMYIKMAHALHCDTETFSMAI